MPTSYVLDQLNQSSGTKPSTGSTSGSTSSSDYVDKAKALIELAKGSQKLAPKVSSQQAPTTTTKKDDKLFHFEDFGKRFAGELNPFNKDSQTMQWFGKGSALAYDATVRPVVQFGLNFNPITQGVQAARDLIPGGADANTPLIPDNKITGQVGGLSLKQTLGLTAETASNFLGAGVLDDLGRFSLKTLPKTKALVESGIVGGLGAGGYEAEQKDSTVKSIAQQAAFGTAFGGVLGSIAPVLSWLSRGVKNQGVVKFTSVVENKLANAGLLEEAEGILAKTKQDMQVIKAKGVQFEDVFNRNLMESQNGKKIVETLKVLDEATPSPTKAADELVDVTKPMEEKLANAADEAAPSGKGLTGQTQVQQVIKDTVDHRIPAKTIRVTERSMLIKQFKDQAKGARAGFVAGKADLQALKKEAETFIKQTIPDSGLTKGQASRLLTSLANVSNHSQLADLHTQALKIAEDSARKTMISDLKTSVRDVLAKQPRITGSMIGKANEVPRSVFAVAQREREEISLLRNFLKIDPENVQTKNYKTVSGFLKAHPIFGSLPKDVLEGIALGTKSAGEIESSSLSQLSHLVDSLVEAGKARTQMDAIRRGQNIEQAVDRMASTVSFVDVNSAQRKFSAGDMESQFWTTQTWFDEIDSNLMSKSKWRRTGEAYETLKRPVDEASSAANKEGADLGGRFAAVLKGKSLGDSEWTRIAIYAYSKQPSARSALLKQVDEEIVNSIRLTPVEQEVYDFMRKELDDIKPTLDGTMLETQGRMIGHIENYFPLMRDYNSFDDVAHALEAPISQRNLRVDMSKFKQSAKFSNLTRSRGGKIDQFADIKMNAGEIFMKYMEKAIYFKHMELPIQNIQLITANERFRALVGPSASKFLESWKNRLARMGSKESIHPGLDNVLTLVKRNLSAAYLARISTATKQFTSAILASGYISPGRVMEGFSFLPSKKWREFAYEKSNTLRLRSGGDVDLFDIQRSIKASSDKSFMGALSNANTRLQQELIKNTVQRADAMTATAVWIGSYKKALKMYTGDEARAIQYADDIVDRTQVSGHFKDIARVQNINTMINAVMPFQTFVIGQWNVIRQDLLKATYLNVAERNFWGSADGAGLFLALSSAMMAESALDYAWSDPEYKDATLLQHWESNLGPSALSNIPVAGAIINEELRGFGDAYSPLGKREIGNVASDILHPLDTWNQLASVYMGGVENGLPKSVKSGSALLGLPVGLAQDIYRIGQNLNMPDFDEPVPTLDNQKNEYYQNPFENNHLGQ